MAILYLLLNSVLKLPVSAVLLEPSLNYELTSIKFIIKRQKRSLQTRIIPSCEAELISDSHLLNPLSAV